MAEWIVKLAGDPSDLRVLAGILSAPELRLEQEGEEFALRSTAFAPEMTNEEVVRVADEMLALISGACCLALDARRPITIHYVIFIPDQGPGEAYLEFMEEVHARDSISITIFDEQGSVQVVKPSDSISEWLTLASHNQSVAMALRLLRNSDLSWVNLYRILDAIVSDVGGTEAIAQQGWASNALVRLFKHTANSVAALGEEARHGAEQTQPPKKPMLLSEARTFILGLAHSWLRSKTSPSQSIQSVPSSGGSGANI